MKEEFNLLRVIWRWLACLIIAFAVTGCATVKLVSDYDEQIDKGTTTLQKNVETFLEKLESSAAKPTDKVAAYADNKQFYADTRIAISGLRLRADATERNSLTVRELDKLRSNIDELENMHKEGITRIEIEKLIRPGLTQQFTAIMTFELAKRRGETPDESKVVAKPTPNITDQGAKK